MLKAAALYFGVTFCVGFALGVVRVLWVVPRVGAVVGVLIEGPFMLLASVLVARWVLRRYAAGAGVGRRLAIGAAAFVMLMSIECGMSWIGGVGPREFAASLLTGAGAIGLVFQVGFGLMPVVCGGRGERSALRARKG